jgi:hypothetical protein
MAFLNYKDLIPPKGRRISDGWPCERGCGVTVYPFDNSHDCRTQEEKDFDLEMLRIQCLIHGIK